MSNEHDSEIRGPASGTAAGFAAESLDSRRSLVDIQPLTPQEWREAVLAQFQVV